jgi:hypothetical protein
MLRRIGWSDPSGTLDTSATCALLAAFAGTESAWRQTIRRKAEVGDDAALKSALEHAEAELAEASAAVLDAAVRTGARKGDKAIEAVLDTDPRRKKWVPRADLLRYVRAWAVTNQSARYFPPDPALFDLVIIDEASQCGIPGMLPLLFRAKRALVIGDPMQLPHITTIDAVEESRVRREAGLDAGRLERDRLAYRPNSAFHAAEHAAGDALLLDEHFRCHPAIAGFANRMFYKDELTVLTDVRGRPAVARPAVVWADVQGAAERIRGGSWRNPTEVAKVVASVRYLLEKLPDRGTVGVVTPYRAQQEAVVGALRKSGLADDPRVLVGTVHAFQGGERDAVVFTLVAGPGMRQSSVNRIARQADLWNVAVTRARSHLIVVGDAALWERQGGFGRALRQAAADAEGASGFAGEGPSDPLAQRLYEQLVKQGKDVGLGGAVNGYTADAVFDAAAGRQAVHLDRGAAEDTEPGRHLRLSLRRTDLLNDPVQGTTGLRIPAWTLYDVDSSR